jgi:flavin reductase (DIM6/NTAB) family NADH-FMN oxidoreductase RutF
MGDEEPIRTVHELVSQLDYPMFIVCATAGGERAGCLVGFATQCSINPPRFLLCLSDKNRTFRLAREATVMIVHLVPADAWELAELFGSHTGDEADKFERCRWSAGPKGTPVLAGCRSWFAGRILDTVHGGDHVGFLLEPFEAAGDSDERPLTFQSAKALEPGHEA